MWGPPSGNR